MVEINKAEAAVIRNKIKDVHICSTKRKRYVEETASVLKILGKLRDVQNVTTEYPASK